MNAARFKFTYEGGPLDGITAGPFPPATRADGLAPELAQQWIAEASTLCRAQQRRGKRLVAAQGRYNIHEDGERYRAVHVPSEEDIYFPPIVLAPLAPLGLPENLPPPPKAASTLDLQ